MFMFLNGAAAMGCLVAALLFLRFWRDSHERLFFFFSVAFWIFAVNYGVLGLVPLAQERRWYVFMLRLVGFLAILWGIVQKNRQTTPWV
jgi:Family of unknown function (DUF5985)